MNCEFFFSIGWRSTGLQHCKTWFLMKTLFPQVSTKRTVTMHFTILYNFILSFHFFRVMIQYIYASSFFFLFIIYTFTKPTVYMSCDHIKWWKNVTNPRDATGDSQFSLSQVFLSTPSMTCWKLNISWHVGSLLFFIYSNLTFTLLSKKNYFVGYIHIRLGLWYRLD